MSAAQQEVESKAIATAVEMVQPDLFREYCTIENGVGITFKKKTPFDAWLSITGGFVEHHRQALFILGDCLRQGEAMFGEKYAQAVDATRYDIKTLTNAVWVCKAIETARRRNELSFSHHKEVASLPKPEQTKMLQQAIDNKWSVAELAKQIKEKYPDLKRKTKDKVGKASEKHRVKFNLADENAIMQCGQAVIAYFEQAEAKGKISTWRRNRIKAWLEIAQPIDAIFKRLKRSKGVE